MKRPYPEVYIAQERLNFLHAAAEHPSIRLADALHADVYALVLRKPKADYEQQFTPEAIGRRAEIERAIQRWAERFHLDVGWVIQEAHNAINTWQLRPGVEPTNPFTWRPLYVHMRQFEWPNWLVGTKEAEYRTLANNAWSAALEAYIDEVKVVKAREKSNRSRDARPVRERYEWAALRICLGWRFPQIAETYSVGSPQAIQESFKSLCEIIGLSS
jgi:hypothetical protein